MKQLLVIAMITIMFVPLASAANPVARKYGPPNNDDPVVTEPYTAYGTDNGDKYALCIGISDYEGNRNDLNFCDDDALAWKDLLVAQGYYVLLSLDGQATADNLELCFAALDALENDAADQVFVTYSGHGGWYDDTIKSCIISADLMWCSNTWMNSLLSTFDSQAQFVFIDACEAGWFAHELEQAGRIICVGSQYAGYYTYDDSTTQMGIFSYYATYAATNLYDNVEDVCAYAMSNFIDWVIARGGLADPQYTDNYAGVMII